MMDSTCGIPVSMNVEPSGYSGGNNNNGWGGDSWWIILLFICLFGWGGFGGYGGFGNGGGGANNPGLQGLATRADINEGFALNNLQGGINAIQQGICDATYALNNALQTGFNTTQMGMMQGFNGVQAQICNLGAQLQSCCCDVREAIQNTNFNMAQNTCAITNQINNSTRDIVENQNSNARAILDFLTQDKIATLTAENQSLKFQASQTAQNAYIAANQQAQTAELIRRLGADCPTPAYVVQPPTPVNFPTNCCGQFSGWGNGYNNGCGNCGGCNC